MAGWCRGRRRRLGGRGVVGGEVAADGEGALGDRGEAVGEGGIGADEDVAVVDFGRRCS